MYEMNALIDELNARDYSERNRLSAILGNSQNIVMDSNGRKIQLKSAPSNMVDAIDYSRPIELFGGKKGFWHKTDPDAVVDAEGNIIRRYGPSREQQIADMKFRKAQQDIELGNLQQKKMQQELSNAGRAPAGYRYTQDGNMEVIPGGPADLKAQALDANKAAGAADVDLAVGTLRDAYDRLDQGGGITNTNKGTLDNLVAGASSSAPGQMVGKMLGTKNQSARNEIEMTRPALLAALMKATGMSAKQMDSNAELKLWMRTATDPTLDVQANRAALSKIEQKYLRGVQPQQQGGAQIISEARNAIMGGAPREAVIQRLESMGITNHGL